eukprot:gene6770-8423_t
MALMVGAMTIHNIQPGPQVMTANPELFWGLIASMWIGNLMLVVLNLPLIGIWIKLLTVPYRWLFPSIVLFCAIGVYSTNNNTFDIWMVGLFGVIGYAFIKLGTEPAPLLLGFILGPMMEEYLRRALLLSRGDWSVFLTRPLSAGLLAAAVLLLVVVLMPYRSHLPEAMSRIGALATRYSNVTIVLDHIGFPTPAPGPNFGFSPAHLALAAHGNVYYKYTSLLIEQLQAG